MDKVTAVKLQKILEAAAIAPGNQERFLAAGLLLPQRDTGRLQLAADWQTAFSRLPMLSKETVRSDPGQFLATIDNLVYRGSTSGTSGQHYIYFADTNWNQTRLETRAQSLQGWGIDDTVTIVNVASRLFPLRPQDTTILGAIDETLIQALLTQLDLQPVAIRGYPSRLCEVATLLLGKPIPPCVAIICTGECLFEFQQHLLEQVFSAPAINEYGCQESGISGLTCPETGRLHLDDTRCFYEVVDGQLVTTDLLNTVMPLVRYQCGDILQFDAEPCPCGRTQPTATVLGRQEEWINTVQGQQRPGAVTMPAFDGILHYQIVQAPENLTIQIYADDRNHPLSFEEMAAWVEATFGTVSVQVLLETLPSGGDELSQGECTPHKWIQGITQEAWTTWFHPPILPTGELRLPAQLLSAIVSPNMISNDRNMIVVQQLLQQVLNQPVAQSSIVEEMIVRVLFFASSCLSHRLNADPIYRQVLDRLYQLQKKYPDSVNAAIFDAFIATLSLPIDSACSIWRDLLQNRCPQAPIQPDTFHIQHLLHGFEPAVQRANASKTSLVLPALSPLLAVLIGDLETLGGRSSLAWIAHWFELLYGQAPTEYQFEWTGHEFTDLWQSWRQHLIRRSTDRHQMLQKLSNLARSPQQHARVLLEQGYELLLEGQLIDPEKWLPQVESTLQSKVVTPVAWAPILRSLTKSLLSQKQHHLAYECLLASIVPASQAARFEQLAHPCNSKQAVLLNLDA